MVKKINSSTFIISLFLRYINCTIKLLAWYTKTQKKCLASFREKNILKNYYNYNTVTTKWLTSLVVILILPPALLALILLASHPRVEGSRTLLSEAFKGVAARHPDTLVLVGPVPHLSAADGVHDACLAAAKP